MHIGSALSHSVSVRAGRQGYTPQNGTTGAAYAKNKLFRGQIDNSESASRVTTAVQKERCVATVSRIDQIAWAWPCIINSVDTEHAQKMLIF